MVRRWVMAVACVGILGCAEQAPVPRFPVDANEETRRALYEQYRLVADVGTFSATWRRRDGEYSWDALADVAQQYPESADVYERAIPVASS